MKRSPMPDWVRNPKNQDDVRKALDWSEAFLAGCEVTRRHLMRRVVLPLLVFLLLAVALLFRGTA